MTFFTLRLTKICLQALNLLLLAHFEKRYISDVKRRYGFIVAPAAKLLLDLLTYECGVNKVWTEGEGVVDRHGKTGRKVFFCPCQLAGCIIIYCPPPLASQRILPETREHEGVSMEFSGASICLFPATSRLFWGSRDSDSACSRSIDPKCEVPSIVIVRIDYNKKHC